MNITLTAGQQNPVVISNWQQNFAATYGQNPQFLVEQLISVGNYADLPTVAPQRSFVNGLLDSITFDFGSNGVPDGMITVSPAVTISAVPILNNNYIYLINLATFAGYEDISMNVKPERILVFVKKAQELDLKPFLGHALYYDFIKWIDVNGTFKPGTPQQYINLFIGSTYTDPSGNTNIYEGMVPALIYWTFARFIEADAIRYTASGPAKKKLDDSDPLTVSELNKIVQQQRSVANAHANEIERFIWDNKGLFPLWYYNPKNKTSRQAGPRIRAVDRTDFNYPGNGYSPNGYGTMGLNEFLP